MEKQPLLGAAGMDNSIGLNVIYKKRPSFYWTSLMWTLGLIEWNSTDTRNESRDMSHRTQVAIQRCGLRRRFLYITSVSFLLLLILGSVFTIVWYFTCLPSHESQFLRFGSYVFFYWPVVTSVQIICIVAAIKNLSKCRSHTEDEIAWFNIFSEHHFANMTFRQPTKQRGFSNTCTFLFFYTFAVINSVLEIAYLVHLGQDCHTWSKYICHLSNVGGLLFYANFCYFLYRNRVAVQEESTNTITYIRSHFGNRKDCTKKVGELFKNYLRLRKLLFPWINLIIFSTSFGMAIFFTWNRQDFSRFSNDTNNWKSLSPSQPWVNKTGFCMVSCEINSTSIGKSNGFILFDMMVLGEKVMVVALALFAVGAMDLSYIWDRVKTDIKLLSISEEDGTKNYLHSFVKDIHPDTTSATLVSFIVPLLGIAWGTLSGHLDCSNSTFLC